MVVLELAKKGHGANFSIPTKDSRVKKKLID